MYYRLANKTLAREFYQKENLDFYESEFFSFDLNENQKILLDLLFKNEPKGLYSMENENLDLCDRLNIFTGNARYIQRIYRSVKDHIRSANHLQQPVKVNIID